MNYKRLTNNNRDEYDAEYDFCCDCKYFGEPCGCNRPNGTCSNYDRFLETYNRLTELEDKIEAGTLVELPCKVGDKVYVIPSYTNVKLNLVCEKCGMDTNILNKVVSWYIDHITFYENDYTISNEYDVLGRGESFGETWFFTYEEAEAKLKEYIEKSKALLEK